MPGPQLPSSPRSNKLAGTPLRSKPILGTGGVDRLFDGVAQWFGRLDVVVHNAHSEMNDAALYELVAVNLTAA